MTRSTSDYYLKKLAGPPASSLNEGLESAGAEEPALGEDDIKDRVKGSKEELYRVIKEYLGDNAEMYAIADKVAAEGRDALAAVRDRDEAYIERKNLSGLLEVIVRTDGSRPSFLITNGRVDKASSPIGTWGDVLDANAVLLSTAIECTGRVNLSGTHIGTGFLVHKNFILTNRHVMQEVAVKETSGLWKLKPGAVIDFGHEFRGRASAYARPLKQIVFCGRQDIDRSAIDHAKLDMVLIELEPAQEGSLQQNILSIDISTEWSAVESSGMVYTIGYPADPRLPGLAAYGTLLEQLFHTTYGYKRLAPGAVVASAFSTEGWTVAHDATTLGGNSGSCILRVGREFAAVAIHYGGTLRAPRENWGHILGKTLDAQNLFDARTFKEVLHEKEVMLIDNYLEA